MYWRGGGQKKLEFVQEERRNKRVKTTEHFSSNCKNGLNDKNQNQSNMAKFEDGKIFDQKY